MKLNNRVAILTGAGRGIGEAIALAYAKEGASLTLVSRTPQELERVADAVKQYGSKVLPLKGDVAKEKTAQTVVKQTIDAFGKVDILVNCAGMLGPVGRFDTNEWKKWKETLDVNLYGSLLFIREVLPSMMESKYGKIINFSGGGATNARPNFTAYTASKVALVRLTETLAQEYKEFHIDINAIAPGAVNTKMLDETLAAGDAAGAENYKKTLEQKEKGGTSPDVAAQLAVYLGSAASDGLTGKLLSAPWDNWREFKSEQNKAITTSSLYTLRRIDNMQFIEKKE